MPRVPRYYLKTQYFHIITQGINKMYIFDTPEDINYYINTMYKLSNLHKVKIISYCIMNNHAHILVKIVEPKELSKFMQRLNLKYGIYYNKKYNRVGYLFRDRFKSEGIFTEQHLYNCIKYIYDNPVKAGMCKRPEEYRYSNYKKIPNIIDGNYEFIDIEKEEQYKDIIENFLNKEKIEMTELKKNNELLKEVVEVLNTEYEISLRKISEALNINREKIRKIISQ